MGKKPRKRLESKGKPNQSSIELNRVISKSLSEKFCKRLRKSKEKGLGICFHIFTKVVYRIAI